MKTKNIFKRVFFALFFLTIQLTLAQNIISGKVVDSENQEAIPGANVIVVGSNTGAVADFNGNFTLNTSAEFPLTIEVSYVGYSSQSLEVVSQDQEIVISLDFGQNLNEVVISASRRSEKILDAPASVSIISTQDIENTANVNDPVRNLINIPGLQFQQQSANSINFEMRAGSGVFGTSVFPILDYRFLQSPASGSFFAFQSGLSNLDIERIEIVRGAASALYGPGVESGVVHFFSKKAIDKPGTSVELIGGNLSTLQGAIRHAYANDKKTFGFKINAQYKKGDEFSLDPVEDAQFLGAINAATANGIFQPTVRNNRIDPAAASNQVLSRSDIDPDGDGNAYLNEYETFMANAHLEFRPNDKTDAVISGGINSGNGLINQSQGPGYAAGNDYWGQARIRSGGFFGQLSYTANDGGSENAPFYLYLTAQRIITKRSALDVQLQYSFDTENFLDSNFTFGADYRDIGADSENTLFGINDGSNDYINYGVYGQGTSRFSDKLDLTYALRYDKLNFVDKGKIAPRIALVFKPNAKNSFRLTYNEAVFGPSALETYVDFPVQIQAPGILDVWLSGQTSAQNFDPNAPIEVVGGGGQVYLPANTTDWPLAVPYGAVAGQVLPLLYQGVGADPNYAPLLPLVQNFFSTYQPSGTSGTIQGYNAFNGTPMPQAVGTPSALLGTTTSWEVGYKGLLGDKFAIGLDVYTFARTGSTQFTAIGPTFRLTGAENIPNDLGAQVAADFAADPVISGAITQAVTALTQAAVEDQYRALGIPEAIWATGAPAGALGPGTPAVAPVSAAVAAAAPGQIAAANAEVATLVGGAFIQGGQAYVDVIKPVAEGGQGAGAAVGAIESQRVPQGDNITHISAGYRIFDNVTRSHWGSDLSMEYFATEKLTFWGNASWLSQNEWNPGEENDDDLPFQDFLNAPRFKFRLGMDYLDRNGFQFSLAFQHDDEFNSNQGFYAGTVQEKNLVDASIGYRLSDSVKLDLSSTNLFNQQYRAFPNMPVIGRRLNLRLVFDF